MKELSIFQTIIYIGFIIRTKTPCPKVHVHLVADNFLKTKINGETTVYYLHKEVIWPGRINVDKNGTVQLQFNKKCHENWPNPIATPVKNNSYPVGDHWMVEILANEAITPYASLVSFTYFNRIYNYVYPRDYYKITQFIEGSPTAYWFIPLPMLPLRDLFYPNQGPGMWRSMGESFQLIANSQPSYTVSAWVAKRPLGTALCLSGPFGSFNPWNLQNKTEFFFVVTGTGVRNVLSLTLWILQTQSEATICLLIFARGEMEVMWKREMKGMSVASNNRFRFFIILSMPSMMWKGIVGKLGGSWLLRYIPLDNDSNFEKMYIGIAGRVHFVKNALRILRKIGYPSEIVFQHSRFLIDQNANCKDFDVLSGDQYTPN